MSTDPHHGLSWPGIVRLGVAQMALGALAAVATSTLNRVMVVELALPAVVPGLLVGLHYALQLLRPGFGHASDQGRGRAGWIVAGVAVLAAGVVLAAGAVGWMADHRRAGLGLAVIAYALVGIGIGAMGTSVLTAVATGTAPSRRPAAATVVWLMMIAGSAICAGVLGRLLQPFSYVRLVHAVAAVATICVVATVLAVIGPRAPAAASRPAAPTRFATALREVWADRAARRFAAFVFASMLAYSGQELILEPFAGLVFALGPAATAKLSGLQHGGVLVGMLLVALAARRAGMRPLTIGGCVASSVALIGLCVGGQIGPAWPLSANVALLGVANGAFAASAIAAMMQLADRQSGRAGTRMGVWGAAQAVAFGAGGLVASGASDLGRALSGSPAAAYAAVFMLQAALFAAAAVLAGRVFAGERARGNLSTTMEQAA